MKVAESLYWRGQIEEAFAVLRATQGLEARLLEAQLFMYQGNLNTALEILAIATSREDMEPVASEYKALCCYLAGDVSGAVQNVIAALVLDPNRISPMTLFSRTVRDRGDISRYLSKKAKHGHTLSMGSTAAFVRACARARATLEGENAAREAILEYVRAQKHKREGYAGRNTEVDLNAAFANGQDVWILKQVAETAETAGIRFFPMGGTLLGLVRSGGLIGWDKDLDFGCFAEEASLRDLWAVFSTSPYFVPVGMTADRLLKLRHLTGVTIDVFINFKDDAMRWHGGSFVCWENRDFQLKPMEVEGARLYIPDDPDAYLTYHYGANWRTPDRDFDVFWEAPNIRDVDERHRYLNTIARTLHLLDSGSWDSLRARRGRANAASVEDVVAGQNFVLSRLQGPLVRSLLR